MTWSKIRHKLENEYLADALKGRITYFCTTYTSAPDHNGRAAIRLDGKEIVEGSYYEQWSKAHLIPKGENYEARMKPGFRVVDDTALKFGQFDQTVFYKAFEIFDSEKIEDSLKSDNALVRIFAILDRRVGKRTLLRLKENIEEEPEIFRLFFSIRAEAEGLI